MPVLASEFRCSAELPAPVGFKSAVQIHAYENGNETFERSMFRVRPLLYSRRDAGGRAVPLRLYPDSKADRCIESARSSGELPA